MQVCLADLKTVCDRLFEHLADLEIDAVELEHDYYWHIPEKARFNVYEQPMELTIGQLSDDWSDLRKVLDGTSEPVAYNFVDLAALLQIIGETTVV